MSASVLIQSLIHRAAGTEVELYGHHYLFTSDEPANPKLPHVCAVPFAEAAAIHRFLAIKEGFKLVDPNAELPPKPQAPRGQTVHADKATAPAAADKPEVEPIFIQNGEGEKIELTAMSLEELQVMARDEFKIKVHHKWTPAVIIGKIVEATRGED